MKKGGDMEGESKDVNEVIKNLATWMCDFTDNEEDWLPGPEDAEYSSKADYLNQLIGWVWQHAPAEQRRDADWWKGFGFPKSWAKDLAS